MPKILTVLSPSYPLVSFSGKQNLWKETFRAKRRVNNFYFLIFICYLNREVSLWHLHMCLQCILIRFIPSIILPHPPLPFLEQFQHIAVHLCTQVYKVDPKIKHIHKNKHDHILTQRYSYSMELGESRKRKENDRASVIPHKMWR
jgi:hypothetical protein